LRRCPWAYGLGLKLAGNSTPFLKRDKELIVIVGCSSVVEHLLSIHKALGLIPSTKKRKEKN
jgi:hypothetical protein